MKKSKLLLCSVALLSLCSCSDFKDGSVYSKTIDNYTCRLVCSLDKQHSSSDRTYYVVDIELTYIDNFEDTKTLYEDKLPYLIEKDGLYLYNNNLFLISNRDAKGSYVVLTYLNPMFERFSYERIYKK